MTEKNGQGTESGAPHESAESPHGTGRMVARSAWEGTGHRSHRTDAVVSWIGWHLGELTGVGVPTVLAVTVHPLWTVPGALVAAGWIANEIRMARHGGSRWTALNETGAADAPTGAVAGGASDAPRGGGVGVAGSADEEVRRGMA